MSKRIALFFDGTWNTPEDRTNVQKMRESVFGETSTEGRPPQQVIDPDADRSVVYRLYKRMRAQKSFRVILGLLNDSVRDDGPDGGADEGERRSEWQQIKYYHRGVGTIWGEKLLGGLFGWKLSRNITDAYIWLAQQFEPGDQVFVFGFSRGAYTARSFVGLISRCGILINQDLPELKMLAKEAYQIYRQKPINEKEAETFRLGNSHNNPDPHIKLIGVWDTVGALGIPPRVPRIGRHNFEFHDVKLCDIVENAYHAMALDEHRPDFDVTVWSNNPPALHQTVEQRWFIGAHSNVGGGYGPKDRLPDISLEWMQGKAIKNALEFKNQVSVHPQAFLDPIRDSYEEFLPNLLSSDYQKRNPPINRTRGGGINETRDRTIQMRVDSGGTDEKGNKYEG
jgi:uncharacterized protein (DUF2235 family)